jgi:DNA-binding response OmpR family regulator
MGNAVLIVDDDVNAQIIAETLLRLRGFAVRVASETADAVDRIANTDVGVVLVDLNMPGMNGFEGLRRLRAAAGALATPPRIIVMTDRQAPEVDRFAQRIGADAVLRKPLAPGQLIATVERLMPAVSQPAPQALSRLYL